MDELTCDRCGSPVPEDASFCPSCGVALGGSEFRARLLAGAVVGLELLAMLLVAAFVEPRLTGMLHSGAAGQSSYTRMVFASWWMPSWMAVVLAGGYISVFTVRSNLARTIGVATCLTIGLLPLIATTMGIYVATLEAATAAGGNP